MAHISAKPVFLDLPILLVPPLSPLSGFDSMAIFCQGGTKNTGCAWISPCYILVKLLILNHFENNLSNGAYSFYDKFMNYTKMKQQKQNILSRLFVMIMSLSGEMMQ